MKKEIVLQVHPDHIHTLTDQIAKRLGLPADHPFQYEILRKSLDARGQRLHYQYRLRVYLDEPMSLETPVFPARHVQQANPVHIIGSGPAGLFCALQCITLGYKPILFERGKMVRDRRRDLARLNREGILNEESNYCFGEGGAGTYSDGKLYTRSDKRGNIKQVLEWFHVFGADASILYEAHPHIGTNKLPHIIEGIREEILRCGGEIYFQSKLTDVRIQSDQITHIHINNQDSIPVRQVVLATGHSASDIYELCARKQIRIEAKPFAMGLRVEHPQALIDEIQYHGQQHHCQLPPASYRWVEQVGHHGVFSFCMCPGGIIAPASTQQNALVVNGWSPSRRNNVFANSGIVVSVGTELINSPHPLAGLHLQRKLEQDAFRMGGGKFVAPAQRLTDFIEGKCSSSLPPCSYHPGLQAVSLQELLPSYMYSSLAVAFRQTAAKMKGYMTKEAVVVALESRTSSPVRIPRDPSTLQHIQIKNLYPCAEGAGYAGGIVSAAMDGIRVADKIAGR